jgi:signal transduction histidine kinase
MNKIAKKALEEDQIATHIENLSQLMNYYKFSIEKKTIEINSISLEKILNDSKSSKGSIIKCSRNEDIKYFNMKINSISDSEGSKGYIITGEDVTENYLIRKQLEEEREKFINISTELKAKCDIIEILRNREKEHLRHLKDVINNISEGLLVLDNKGAFNFCNPSVYSIINVNPGDLIYYKNIGKKFCVKDLQDRIIKVEELFNCKEKVKNLILSFQSKNEEQIKYIELNINPIYNKLKEVLYTIITFKDVTKSVEHNMELEKVTKMKDEFFTVMSHELRTPLTLIHSSLQLAYGVYGEEITSNIDRTLTRVNQNCSRLLKLINNILDISKAEAGFLTIINTNFEVVSTTEMIVNSVNNFAISKKIGIVFDTNQEELYINLDKDKYEKILLNLLSNAIKFTPEGKNIYITLQIEEKNITLIVKDEGIGIPDNKQESIFDRFTQVNSSLSRRAEGTGLGLSLVKKLVNMMDGYISVRSKLNEGSEFTICFTRYAQMGSGVDNYAMVDVNISEKINIEFSDIN